MNGPQINGVPIPKAWYLTPAQVRFLCGSADTVRRDPFAQPLRVRESAFTLKQHEVAQGVTIEAPPSHGLPGSCSAGEPLIQSQEGGNPAGGEGPGAGDRCDALSESGKVLRLPGGQGRPSLWVVTRSEP